ncbi:MAG: 4Fe-4S binding protein [Eubacterium sp.]|nr:4Fe-4S binding protein [Eubacterium sp.]
MLRRIVKIDEEKCNGCGLCAAACHEGAIHMVEGKARLMRDDYCDGLGDCLPACPTGAISFEMREALPYDEAAVQAAMAAKKQSAAPVGCPGMQQKTRVPVEAAEGGAVESQLSQWPVQIKLVSPMAPFLRDCDLLVAADCTAYAYGDFHREFIKGRITLIGCPKLDEGDYTERLTEVLSHNTIRSIVVTRMQVPCCGGLERAVRQAVKNSGKAISLEVVTISAEGKILSREA